MATPTWLILMTVVLSVFCTVDSNTEANEAIPDTSREFRFPGMFRTQRSFNFMRNIPPSLLLSAQSVMKQLQKYLVQSQGGAVSKPTEIPTIPAASPPNDFPANTVCYYNASAIRRPLFGFFSFPNISVEFCSHIVYLCGDLDANTWEISFNEFTGFLGTHIGKLKERRKDLKVLLSVIGSDESFSLMAGNNARRNVFTNNVLKWVRKFGFDGLVLHWNQPGRKERNSYINLLQEIRSQFSPDNIILNTVLSIDKEILKNNYDLKRLNELVDQFYAIPEGRISMESEFTQTLNPLRSPSDSLNMIDGLQNIVDAGIPRHKILSGISFQGSSFTLASTKYHGVGSPIKTWIGGGNEGAYTKTRGLLSYYEICSGLQKKRLEPGFDSEAFAPYAFKKDQWIAYEDENSVSIKSSVVRNGGFAGVVLWTIDMDDFRGFCGNKNPLLNAINKTFDGYRVSIQDSEILEAPSAPTPTRNPFSTTLTDPTIPTSNPSASASPTIDPFISAAASLASLGSGLLTTTNSNDESGVNVFIPNDIKVNCTTATRKFIAHPVFCSRYYQCIHGIAVPQDCPDKLHWNEEISNCDWPGSSARPICL